MLKGVCVKSAVNITFNGEKLNTLPLRLVIKHGCPFSSSVEVLASAFRRVKEIEVHIGKEVKLSLFAFDMFFFVKNRTESIKKLPEQIISYITI